jgi:hypothetical protein
MAGRAIPALALASTFSVVACYQPTFKSCTVTCDEQHGCPGALQCVGGYCTSGAACVGDGGYDASADASDAGTGEGPTGPSCNRADGSTDVASPPTGNLVVWLDPDPSYVTTGPSFVWHDRSGNNNDATASGQASPTFVPATGGLPAGVQFSGDGQYLTLPVGLPDFHDGIAIFLVIEPRAAPPSSDAYVVSFVDFLGSGGTGNFAVVFGQENLEAGTDGDTLAAFESPGAGTVAPGAVTDDTRQLLEVVADYAPSPGFSSAGIFKNGASLGGSMWKPLPIGGWSSNLIGRSNLASQPGHPDFRGTISELLIYTGSLNQPVRQQIESYLLTRWCLP